MTNLTNYHSHCLYCDGRANMEDFIRFAISEGFTSYGISSHAPLPFPTAWTMEWDRMEDYLSEFSRLKKKYADKIELAIGLEIDYLNEDSNPASSRFRELPLDYRIGSVHMLYSPEGNIVDIDTPADTFRQLIDKHFDGDLYSVVCLYYENLLRMVELGGFDIVGHADKMHYNASCYRPGLLDEPWYDTLVHGYFLEIARHGYIVEINTKAYHELGTFYPNERYFTFLKDLGIRVQVNSDAHYPERINNARPEGLAALKKAGFTSVVEWHGGKWEDTALCLFP
ncbi:histidinol-phosphatase [Bacteroides faecium]|uniref:Histidinol-phosphatase n=1 Tax=Bacteroides faecium TaxID=2715212 RepID=A0A6H0KU81_9BACE|nr:histidinol-phosphatase [Bacteroides faecium]QIU96739.1 histidinol-phosphatase [Bacteroides faecium]